jgi:hypothetical protein
MPRDGTIHGEGAKRAKVILMLADGTSYSTIEATLWCFRDYHVHTAWTRAGLKPHRFERYMCSDDPDFETEAADVIGL